jgi:carboxymethylenebutenolidase
MCYDSKARPPVPAFAGGSGSGRSTVLSAADGNEFAAFTVMAEKARGPGVVILPDVRGLHPFYEELAEIFGAVGVHATAIDYFGRTAGIGRRGEGFDHPPHVARTTPEGVALDTAAAVEHLRSSAGGGATSAFTVGFCFGGRASFNQAARGHGLAGVIGFYGRVAQRDANDEDAPVLLAGSYACPVLGLFGGADASITSDDIDLFGRALEASGLTNDLVVYEGAPHSFFDRTFDKHKDDCDDAWARMVAFIEENSEAGSERAENRPSF